MLLFMKLSIDEFVICLVLLVTAVLLVVAGNQKIKRSNSVVDTLAGFVLVLFSLATAGMILLVMILT